MSKLIAITGVSRGLGLAMTEQFIQSGHTVIGCMRNSTVVEELRQRFGCPHHFAAVDVADKVIVPAWAQQLLANYPPPGLLINNASIINHLAPLWKIDGSEFSQVIDINVKGVVNVIRHLVPVMITNGSGVIVNFSSGWGRSTSPEVAPYCASKWAIEGLTQALAQELPQGLAAIPLNPGIIHTDMLKICYGEAAAAYTPIHRWGQKAVPFLLQLSAKDNGVPLTVPS